MTFIKKKTVLITGASRGIGKCISKIFAKNNYIVIGTSTSETGSKLIKNSLYDYNKNNYGIKLDIKKEKDIENMFNILKNKNTLPDILINNAGVTKDNLLLRLKSEDWFEVIQINLNAIFSISKKFIPNMIKKKWGRIINISSVVALTGNAGQSNYCASKAGMIGFSKSLAQEISCRNITVNSIAPGLIKTDMTKKLKEKQIEQFIKNIPARKIGNTKDIALTAKFLAGEDAEYITGQTIHVNGGLYMP